jgi:cysteinyl-tRNA synthetase
LRAQYRSPQEFSEELLIESKTTFKKISDFVIDSKPQPKNDELLSLFEECMNDDLNTPKLIGEIFTQMNNVTNLENGMLDDIKATVKYIFEILGFTFKKNVTKKVSIEDMEKFFNQYEIIFDSVEQAMSEFLKIREKHRVEKNYQIADEMRTNVLEIGIKIEDGNKDGWSWNNN